MPCDSRWLASSIAWLLCVTLVLTPTTATLANAFHDSAQQGQVFGRTQVPDPKKLFGTNDGGGSYTIFPDDQHPQHITAQQLFGQGSGSAADLKNLWGNKDAVRNNTLNTQQQLQSSPSQWGQAYRVLKSSSQRAHPDLLSDPIWNISRNAMQDIFNGAYSACQVTKHITSDNLKTHLPDYRTCNRVPAAGGDCTVTHDYKVGIIEHAAGPLNIQSCGPGCRDIWVGRIGNNYWHNGHCEIIHEESVSVRILRPDAISDATLDYTKWDDHMQVLVEGQKVWSGPNDEFPPETPGQCELSTSWERTPNVDVTRFFKNVTPGQVIQLKIRVTVGDKGEGYARFRIHFDPDKQVSGDQWRISKSCQSKIDAVNSGFASGAFTCTNSPDQSNGCTTDLNKICVNQLTPSPLPGVSALCRKATVHAALTFNKGQMSCWTDAQGNQQCPTNTGDNSDTCTALENNPSCRYLSSQCIDGASDTQGNCYAYTVRYDCGQDVNVPTANETSKYTCPGGIGCMGGDCVTSTQQTNHDFAHAVAALQAADYMAMDMSCPKNEEQNIDANTCQVFKGTASECKVAVGGEVNCCTEPSNGISLAQYITLINKTRKVASLLTGQGGVLHGTWTKLTGPVKDAWGSINSYFGSSVDANASATPTHLLGVGKLEQFAMRKAANFVTDTFGSQASSMIFDTSQATVSASGDVTGGTVSLAGAVGTALSVVMIAYTVYVVVKLLIHVIWKCEKSEFELGAKRRLKTTHYVGSYCKTKALGVCIEKRNAYCEFNSPLSRILQEQIRPQLGIDWGSAEHPNCRGLSVAEINRVDWDKVNLDEWLAILQTTGHMPASPVQADGEYAMKRLTGAANATMNFDGQRTDTKTRNEQRLSASGTLGRNEALRQSLWGTGGGQGTQPTPPYQPPPARRSPCHPGARLFTYTGSTQHFTVPPQCRRLDVTVVGAASGSADNIAPRSGERITARITVIPGETLPIGVGRGGGVSSTWDDTHNTPAYFGLAGSDSILYQPNGAVWEGARGGAQTGAVAARAAHYWRGQNGWVAIQWGPSPPAPPAPPGRTPIAAPPAPVPPCHAGTRAYYYTGGRQTFTMPQGCHQLRVSVYGADSGSASNIAPRAGQDHAATLSVAPGQPLSLYVGQGGALVYRGGWVGLAGQVSTLYNPANIPWVTGAGGAQTGTTQTMPARAWRGKNGWIVLQWGGAPPAPPAAPQRQPQAVPPPPCPSGSVTYTTATVRTFTMPQACHTLIVHATGGASGSLTITNRGTRTYGPNAGHGASATLSIPPGESLQVKPGAGGTALAGTSGGERGARTWYLLSGGASVVFRRNQPALVSAAGGAGADLGSLSGSAQSHTGQSGAITLQWRP